MSYYDSQQISLKLNKINRKKLLIYKIKILTFSTLAHFKLKKHFLGLNVE